MMQLSFGEKVFNVMNCILLAFIAFATVYPFIFVFSASISSADAVAQGRVLLIPKGFSVNAYQEVVNYSGIWVAYLNAIFYTVVGTIVNLLVTMFGAYPLSKKRLRGRGIITFMVAFTMWFNAGMIPFYLLMKNLSLVNTRTGIIIGFACSAFYVFILRTYFTSVPDSLEESAKIDGASDFAVLFQIYLPLALPALATVGLYYMVGKWNSYFWPMILLSDDSKIPLQVLLRKLIVEMNWKEEMGNVDTAGYNRDTLVYATIILSVLPMLAAYPFIQKYFVKGIMIGSVKG